MVRIPRLHKESSVFSVGGIAAQLRVLADRIALVVSDASTASAVEVTPGFISAVTSRLRITDPEGTSTVVEGGRIRAASLTLGMLAGAVTGAISDATKTATNYITAVDSDGIKVHAANNVNSNYAAIDATGMEVVRGGTSMAKFGADGSRIGRIGMNRIELSEDGLVQYTEDGVIGIRAGLSATNHTVDVTHYLGLNKVYLGDVYWYDTQDGERKSSINVEYPFSSDSPNNIDKFILHMYLSRWPWGGSYDVVVPFGSDFSTIINRSDISIDWEATGKKLTITKEWKDPNEFDHEVLNVEYTGYVTTASKRSPVLLFGEHSGMRSPGLYAVALGRESTSDGDNALTAGIATAAASEAQTAIGKYNVEDSSGTYALIVGNGTADDARSNAAAIDWSGNYLGQAMAGIIQMFAGATPPTGWLVCDGSAVSRTTYATLFAAIGTTWGTGDGSTTFNLPDLRGRTPIGAGTGTGLTARTLGTQNIGTETHKLTAAESGNQAQTVTSAAGTSHSHGANGDTYFVTTSTDEAISRTNIKPGTSTAVTNVLRSPGGALNRKTATSGESAHKHDVTIAAKDATNAHNNMQPSAVVNFIICTGKTS